MPGLPNHFMIFGPYGWTGASWHVLVQTASHHISACSRRRDAAAPRASRSRGGDRPLPRSRRARGKSRSLWFNSNCSTANSYYFDHHGDVPYVRPTSAARR